MKVLSKLVVREVIPPTMIALAIFTFVFLMRTIADLAEKLIEYQYTLDEIGRLLIFSIPAILGYVIPMSLLLGVIVGLNRLSADSEVIAITSSGVSTHSFLFPLMGIAVIAWMANTWILTEAVPWSNEAYSEIILAHTREVVSSEVKPRVFNEDFPGFILYIHDVDQDNNRRWQNVFIYDQNDPDYPRTTLARHADLITRGGSGTVDLNMAISHTYTFPRDEPGQPSAVSRALNNTFRLIEGDDLESRGDDTKDNRAKTITELLEDVALEANVIIFRSTVRNSGALPQPVEVEMEVAGEMVATDSVEVPATGGGEKALQIPLRLVPGYENEPLTIRVKQNGREIIAREFSVNQFADRLYSYAVELQTEGDHGLELRNSKLLRQKTNAYWIEIHKKFALPFTCIIFALLGLPMGLSSRRGGKAYGYVVGITIFILYWGLLTTGERMALYERISPALGVWLPNIVFGVAAILLLFLRRRAEIKVPWISAFLYRLRAADNEQTTEGADGSTPVSTVQTRPEQRVSDEHIGHQFGFPLLVDRYMIKTFLKMFILVFVTVYAVFSLVSFIDVNNDIQKNNVDPIILVDYFQFVAPDTIRWVIPISTLMGTMICFALLSKSSEVIAFKSSGISIYRISIPVVLMALLISVFSFYNNDILIPSTAPRLAEIKGVIRDRPVQTIRDPRNRWVLGEDKNRVYHFQFYNEEQRRIEDLHIFDIDPESYQLARHIFVNRADWDDAGGWEANEGWITTFTGTRRNAVEIAPAQPLPIAEAPTYFGQEIKPSDQMSYAELADYIDTLDAYGFSTTRETFDMHWKLSFPFLPLVMMLLGLPFAFTTSRRGGALTGIFVSILFVIIYWGMMSLFRALGQSGLLPALLAAWAPNIVFLGVGVLLFTTLRS